MHAHHHCHAQGGLYDQQRHHHLTGVHCCCQPTTCCCCCACKDPHHHCSQPSHRHATDNVFEHPQSEENRGIANTTGATAGGNISKEDAIAKAKMLLSARTGTSYFDNGSEGAATIGHDNGMLQRGSSSESLLVEEPDVSHSIHWVNAIFMSSMNKRTLSSSGMPSNDEQRQQSQQRQHAYFPSSVEDIHTELVPTLRNKELERMLHDAGVLQRLPSSPSASAGGQTSRDIPREELARLLLSSVDGRQKRSENEDETNAGSMMTEPLLRPAGEVYTTTPPDVTVVAGGLPFESALATNPVLTDTH